MSSSATFARAERVFPDGTNRITVERDPRPRYVAGGDGAWLTDADGRRLLDLHGNFTALIHGHGFAPVVEAVERQLRLGTCFAQPTEPEVALGELLCARVPGLERLRFVNSGTEAVMFAVKAARAFTGRPAIAKVEGAFHGGYDWAEIGQFTDPETWGNPEAPARTPGYRGTPAGVADDVVVFRLNDPEGAVRLIEAHARRLACVILDPMPSRVGLIPAEPAFLAAVQAAARRHGVLVLADEVLNFRQGFEGASPRFGLAPDLFTFGKIIGGGFPIGAIGGRAEIMAMFDASRGLPPVPQGGTFSANPISMVAGFACMAALDRPAFDRLEQLGAALRDRLEAAIMRRGAGFSVTGAASLLRIHPRATAPRDFREAFWSPDQSRVMAALVRHYAAGSVLLPKAGAITLSTPMGEAEIDLVAELFESFLGGA